MTEEFHKLNGRQQRRLSMTEYVRYREQLRQYDFENSSRIRGVRKRKLYHCFLLPLIVAGRLANRQKLHILADKRTRTKKPVIYACTHIGYYDIIMTIEAIKSHCYLLLSGPEAIYRTFEGWLAETNGIICMNAYSKSDRRIAKETAIRLLRQNGSLLIFPEGAWNITENLPVMKLFRGAVDMALQTGAEIVPIAIEQNGKDFYVNIGRNIKYPDAHADTQALTDALRSELCTLKWEIWEHFPVARRTVFSKESGDRFVEDILAEGRYINKREMLEAERYHDKNITAPAEVFAFMKHLKPNRKNAFLFRN